MQEYDKLLRHNRIDICSACGGKMRQVRSGEFVCTECGAAELDDFGRIRKYMEQHGPASKEELYRVLGVRKEVINEYIRQQRLERAPGKHQEEGKCLLCGAALKFGSICAKCKGTAPKVIYNGAAGDGMKGKKRFEED
ncbi:MAG: hypothetical protein IJ600_05390 [Lachnospiraceae bacterium]|nr:hypothetical protein [Lachnospiraceae bacterium]